MNNEHNIVLIRYLPVVCKAGRGAWSFAPFHGHLQPCNECSRPRRNAFGNLITYALFSIFHKKMSHHKKMSIIDISQKNVHKFQFQSCRNYRIPCDHTSNYVVHSLLCWSIA